jgi:hypothetical protein
MLTDADVRVALQDKLRAMSAALEEAQGELARVRHARASEAAEHDEQVLLYMCPHTAIYASSYYYICVLILLCMCPYSTIYVCATRARARLPSTTSRCFSTSKASKASTIVLVKRTRS